MLPSEHLLLALQGQRKIVIKYAGTSDVIFEDLSNPFDKYRGPPKARR